jgi:hypothetical protein
MCRATLCDLKGARAGVSVLQNRAPCPSLERMIGCRGEGHSCVWTSCAMKLKPTKTRIETGNGRGNSRGSCVTRPAVAHGRSNHKVTRTRRSQRTKALFSLSPCASWFIVHLSRCLYAPRAQLRRSLACNPTRSRDCSDCAEGFQSQPTGCVHPTCESSEGQGSNVGKTCSREPDLPVHVEDNMRVADRAAGNNTRIRNRGNTGPDRPREPRTVWLKPPRR